MIKSSLVALLLWAAALAMPAMAADSRCYELRVYTANPGKLEELQARFRNFTARLFAKQGITNLGYWVPMENPDSKLYYVLVFPSYEERGAMWKEFQNDPEWKAARDESEKNGKLVAKVESRFLQATDFSPEIQPSQAAAPRVFELRTYTTTPGNLDRLLKRFREHTVALFQKHGMTNFAYWTLRSGQPGAENTLIYLLAHASKEAGDREFAEFRQDPEWVTAKAASEKEGGGSLTVPDGVQSLYLQPTDFSPTK